MNETRVDQVVTTLSAAMSDALPFELIGWCHRSDGWVVAVDVRTSEGINLQLPASAIYGSPMTVQARMSQFCALAGVELRAPSVAYKLIRARLPHLRVSRVDTTLKYVENDEAANLALRRVWLKATGQSEPSAQEPSELF